MNRLKIFPKTYIFTTVLMSMVILISHTLLYILLPIFYIDKKQNELSTITEKLVNDLSKSNSSNSMSIANEFAIKYRVNITMNVGNDIKSFEGIDQTNVYIDPDKLKDDNVIIPSIGGDLIEKDLSNPFKANYNSLTDNINYKKDGYVKIKNLSVIKKNNFKSLNGIDGNVKTSMSLESIKECRSVIFNILPYSTGISLAISLIASYIYTRIITDPIKKICNTTRRMEELKKGILCEVYTGDEIELLSKNINSLYKTLWNTIDNLEKEIKNVSKSEKMKVNFLRGASHELKTPLMSINIMLENMILNIGKYKNHDIYLIKCKEEVNRLSKMIQNILDTSNLNTWSEHGDYKLINIQDVLYNAMEAYEITAKHKNIKINIEVSKPLKVETDENLLGKALSNIISNAINYTDEGKNINIYVGGKFLIIENECKPIPNEHLDRIFEAFYRVEFDRNKNTGGNGLGLYIVKQILTTLDILHKFESIGSGMRFTIVFK